MPGDSTNTRGVVAVDSLNTTERSVVCNRELVRVERP